MKEFEKEWMSLFEFVVSKEEEKVLVVVEVMFVVVMQFVLENWVVCDKCEKWWLLMFNMVLILLFKKWCCKMMDWL